MLKKKKMLVKLFEDIKSSWGEIDFVVHAIAFSDKSELSGEYLNTTRENFLKVCYFMLFIYRSCKRSS